MTPGKQNTGGTVTIAFSSGPDYEKPKDADKDNVYEVTLVVTDNSGNRDELDVTVKVINSTEDNRPGDGDDREPAAGGCHQVDG